MEINDNTAALQKLSISINRSALNQINEIKKIYNFIKPYAIGSVYHKLMPSKIKFESNFFRRKLDTCSPFVNKKIYL
jgi:hypothetical protein